MKLDDIKPDPADAHKIWWPLDEEFKGVDFIRQPNEVCHVTLNPGHESLDLNKIMECFKVILIVSSAAVFRLFASDPPRGFTRSSAQNDNRLLHLQQCM